MTSIVISSGHGLKVRGASSKWLDEVDEARLIVEQLATELRERGIGITTYHDDVSTTQDENLRRITDFHNSKQRDLDISVHLNAFEETSAPRGVEVLYVTQQALAAQVSAAIASCGFIDRGAKQRNDLYVLNNTTEPSILIETLFLDSEADVKIYEAKFDEICVAIADALSDDASIEMPTTDDVALFYAKGKASYFGGPDDMGVDSDEPLAFIYNIEQAPQLFLPYQPKGTTGLARRLNPWVPYLACRWDYSQTPKEMLLTEMALVHAIKTGIMMRAFPADWGPHQDTNRIADLSPGLMMALGIETDDEVEVTFPYLESMS